MIISPGSLCVCLQPVAVSTGCAIAVDHAFNLINYFIMYCSEIQSHSEGPANKSLKYKFQSVHIFCREYSYFGVDGWVSTNPYELLGAPLVVTA